MWAVLVVAVAVGAVIIEGTLFGFLFAGIYIAIAAWIRHQSQESFAGELWPEIEDLLLAELGPAKTR